MNNSIDLSIRPISRGDNAAMAEIIRDVLTEFEATAPGFAIHDPEVADLAQAYSLPRSRYFVVVNESNDVLGGAGIGPLAGAEPTVCELRKMYFLPSLRGSGMGKEMLIKCLDQAKVFGYTQCYLETLERMDKARRLYESLGFVRVTEPMGNTGHFACDAWYLKDL